MLFDDYGKVVFYDGAMGTMLLNCGLKPGERPDVLNIAAPEAVENVHRMYVEAGSDIIVTNTFGANAEALRRTGHTPEAVIRAAVDNAKRACGDSTKIALDIGPLGYLLEPLGDAKYEWAYDLFKQQAVIGKNAGADFVAIETMSDLTELEACMKAISDNTDFPMLVTMTFDRTGCTFTGCSPEIFATTAERLGAAAVGLNCSLAPEEMYDIAERIVRTTDLPFIAKPNAGLPDPQTGLYNIGPAEFAHQMMPFVNMGAKLIGGCCGTTPDYIKAMRELVGSTATVIARRP